MMPTIATAAGSRFQNEAIFTGKICSYLYPTLQLYNEVQMRVSDRRHGNTAFDKYRHHLTLPDVLL